MEQGGQLHNEEFRLFLAGKPFSSGQDTFYMRKIVAGRRAGMPLPGKQASAFKDFIMVDHPPTIPVYRNSAKRGTHAP